MKKTGAKKIILPLAIIGVGIGVYFLSKNEKVKNIFKSKATKEAEAAAAATEAANAAKNANNTGITPPRPITTENPFINSSELLAFQQWANKTHAANLVEDGKWGNKSGAAYNSYGQEYAAYKAAYTYSPSILTTPPKSNPLDTWKFKL